MAQDYRCQHSEEHFIRSLVFFDTLVQYKRIVQRQCYSQERQVVNRSTGLLVNWAIRRLLEWPKQAGITVCSSSE